MFDSKLSIVAIALIALGVTTMVVPTYGSSALYGDRGMSVATADDPDAFYGVDGRTDIGELRGDDDPREIALLTNNIGTTVETTVEIEEIPDGDDGVLVASTDDLTLESGESTAATVECREETNVGEQDVVFRTVADGSSAAVADKTFTVTIDIQCHRGNVEPTESGLAGVSVSDLEDGNGDQSQSLEFELREEMTTDETVTITIDGVGNRLDYEGVTLTTDPPGTVGGDTSGNDYEVTFSPEETMFGGETVSITVGSVDASGKHADGTYDVTFARSDTDATEETDFVVE